MMLGWLLADMGDPEALEVLRECLRIRTRHLPEGHRDLGAVHVALAGCLIEQGRTLEAMSAIASARPIFARQENGEQIERAIFLVQQGAAFTGLGLYGPAEKALREGLALAQGFLGPDSMYVCAIHGQLGNTLQAAGKLQEAEAEYRACLAVARRSVSMAHPRMMVPVDNLANLLRKQKRLPEAEPIYQEVVATAHKRLGPKHPGRIAGLLAYAALLAELEAAGRKPSGQPPEGLRPAASRERADQLAGEALDILGEQTGRPPIRHLAGRLNLLGLKLEQLGQSDRALALYRSAAQVCRSEKDGRGEMINHANQAHLLLAMKQLDRAAEPIQQALGIARQQPELPAGDLCFVWETAARLALARKQPGEAEGYYRQWLEVLRKTPRADVGNPDGVVNCLVALLLDSKNAPGEAAAVLGTYLVILEARRVPESALRSRRTEQAILTLAGGNRQAFQQLAAAALARSAEGASADRATAIDLAVLGCEGELTARTLAAARAEAVRQQVPIGLAVAGTPWSRAIGPRLWGPSLLQLQDLLAAALYRAGEYPAAEAALDTATVWRGSRITYFELLFRAMARQRQGKKGPALQDLATAEDLRQRLVPISTNQRLFWKQLDKEARELIRPEALQRSPRQERSAQK